MIRKGTHTGEDELRDSYHYRACGLENVYLLNGFSIEETRHGRTVVIDDMDGLHHAIGRRLAQEKKELTGRELRFLRRELGLSQRGLGELLSKSGQAIARWEKGHNRIDGTAEALFRLLYLEHAGGNRKVRGLLGRLAELDELAGEPEMSFEETGNGWCPRIAEGYSEGGGARGSVPGAPDAAHAATGGQAAD